MANTSAVYARIDNRIKSEAESILAQLGITPSSAIQMLYSQIILNRGLPFVPRIPTRSSLFIGEMTRDELDGEIRRGMDSIAEGRAIPTEEVDDMLASEFGI